MDGFNRLCTKYKIPDDICREFTEFVDKNMSKHCDVIPYSIGVLCYENMDSSERIMWLQVLKEVLNRYPNIAIEMPAFVFNQKDAAQILEISKNI